MKRRRLLLAAAGLAGLASPTGARAVQPGRAVVWPQGVALLDRRPWAPLPGHAHVIVRWATWCGFCQRHNARVNALLRSLPVGAPLQILGVAADGNADVVRRHVQAEGLAFPVTLDAAGFTALSLRRVFPLTITVDRQGRLREIIPGEMAEPDVLALAALAR